MAQYLAHVHKDAGSDFGVSFPDFPGCVSAGSTLEEARAMAAEALALHIEGLRADGETIPAQFQGPPPAALPGAIVILVSVS
jgi:predicted RNase H-like HicB family nuclease